MLETLNRSENVGKGILALIALIPGVAALLDWIPLSDEGKQTLKIAISATSIVTAACVLLLSSWVKSTRPSLLLASIIASFSIGLASLVYWQLSYDQLQVSFNDGGQERVLILPIVEGPLQKKYASQSLTEVLENENVGASVIDEIDSRNDLTPVLWTFLLVLAQFGLTSAIILGILRLATEREEIS